MSPMVVSEEDLQSSPHLWSLTSEMAEVPNGGWVQKFPTGMAWGACSCGLRIEGFNGQPIPERTVREELRQHLEQQRAKLT